MVSFLFLFLNYLSRLARRFNSRRFIFLFIFFYIVVKLCWYILASNKGLKRRFYTRRFAVFKIPGGKCRIHHPTDIFFIPIVKRKVPYTNIQFGLHCIYAYLSFRPWQLCHAENSTATRKGGGERERGRGRGSAVLTKCQEVRNLWQFSFPLILFTLFPCLFTIRHFKLHFIRNSNTRSTVDLTQDGTFFENLEYALKIRYSGKKIGKKIANDFTIFLQNSVSSFSSKYLHFSSKMETKKRKKRNSGKRKREKKFSEKNPFRRVTSRKIIWKPCSQCVMQCSHCVLASLSPLPPPL